MPTTELDGIFYVSEPPKITYEDGLFRLCYAIGRRATFEVVMRPSVFTQTRLHGAEACAKWLYTEADAENVQRMPPK